MNPLLHAIASSASPLHERLAGAFVPADGVENARLCEERWDRWSKILSKDDPAVLARRLELGGIDPERARVLLGAVRQEDGSHLPQWTQVFQSVLIEAERIPAGNWPAECERYAALAGEWKWKEFLLPFLKAGRNLLQHRAGSLRGWLSPEAEIALERALLRRLHLIANHALELEFSLLRIGAPGVPHPLSEPDRGEFARQCYAGMAFFSSYPAAARLLSLAVEFWVEAGCELLARLEADAEEIAQTFWPNTASASGRYGVHGQDAHATPPSRIEFLTASLSDPHCRGRGVVILEFSAGGKLVYKPRSLGMEAAYFGFVEWVNGAAGTDLEMKTLRVLDRGNYGWMEFAAHEECGTDEAVARFFEREGGLLALLYALAGSDMHFENLIAHGEHPLPVDLEVLMVPWRNPFDDAGSEESLAAAYETLTHSVLSVGLLPSWVSIKKGQIYNAGGLGAVAEEDSVPLAASQLSANTPQPPSHIPRVGGKFASSHHYREEILRGFHSMYDFLLAHREEILGNDGPLARFKGLPVRFVNRPTALYGRALMKALSASALESGALRSLELDIFLKNAVLAEERDRHAALVTGISEILAMERGDIPFFQGWSNNRDLDLPGIGGKLENFFTASGYEIARRRLEGLSLEDLRAQTQFIRLSFDLIGNTGLAKTLSNSFKSKPKTSKSETSRIEREIDSIVQVIHSDAIRKADDVTWIAPQLIPETEAFRLMPASGSLYDGSLGVMLFLFALGKYRGDKESRALAHRIFHSFRKGLQNPLKRTLVRQLPPGLAGIGGQIYSLLLASELADDSRLAEAAIELGNMVSDEALLRDTSHDVTSGVAGAIPAFLFLHAKTGDNRWFEKATLCGDHLLSSRMEAADGKQSWKCSDKFLAGYSHGAAGIASSLLRLHAIRGEVRFKAAADEAIAYENTLFDPEARNWRDIRWGTPGFMISWCHGAPGVALGRMLGANGNASFEGDLAEALQTTAAGDLHSVDQCCCGTAGRADVLLTAARRLNRDAFRETARELMEQTAATAHRNGGYACYGTLPRTVRGPGFFQGLSGIGYTLLRLEYPELPSVLAMEA